MVQIAHVAQSVERFLGKEEVLRFNPGRGLHFFVLSMKYLLIVLAADFLKGSGNRKCHENNEMPYNTGRIG